MIHKIIKLVFILIVWGLILIGASPKKVNAQYPPPVTPTGGIITQSPTGTVSVPAQSSTPAQSFTPSPVPSSTSTTTLMPMPAITLIYPASTNTVSAKFTPIPVVVTNSSTPAGSKEAISVSPRIRVITIVLIVLWIILAGFLIVYIRQFR